MEGPFPDESFESDGITMAPDFIGSVDCRPAGHWHDYAYSLGNVERDRQRADEAFFRNLIRCGLPVWLAGVEYRRVRLWGLRHFAYIHPPRGFWWWYLLLRCFLLRYREVRRP